MQRPFCKRQTVVVLLAVACLALSACANRQNTPPLPPVNIGVAWFTQPAETADLLAGFLPENTPRVDSKDLGALDITFSEVLRTRTQREYSFPEAHSQCMKISVPDRSGSGRAAALHYWTAVGRCMNVDYLLVPQIISFRERDGSNAGVISPAAVVMDIFLIDVRESRLVGRSHFDEVQAALADNLLDAGRFISRRGRWITANELAGEGMARAVEELGL